VTDSIYYSSFEACLVHMQIAGMDRTLSILADADPCVFGSLNLTAVANFSLTSSNVTQTLWVPLDLWLVAMRTEKVGRQNVSDV
jgi:hypothetical protein